VFPFCSKVLGRTQLAGLPLFGIGKNGQTFFRWAEPDEHRNDRVFFAILVERMVAVPLKLRATGWQQESGLRGKLVPIDHMHISLVGLGDHDGRPDSLIEIARHIGSMIQAKPFDVSFDRLSAFGGGALVLRGSDSIPSLQAFWRILTAAIADSPLKSFVTNSFEPHVTLLRDKVRVPSVHERVIEPVSWTVRDFVLIHSLIQEGRYELPGRWQLNGQDDSVAAM
jgi:2'-5' RNA ligase